ncbi:MAG: winged helix-turn-helix transcriptional regulator [Succinivibrio sp.]
MYQKKKKDDIRCPLEYAITLISGKWNSRILCVLHTFGVARYSKIREELATVSDTVLSSVLKDMLGKNLIVKHVIPTDRSTPHVEYELSDYGKSLLPALQELCRWSGVHFTSSDGSIPICRRCGCSIQMKDI